MENTARSVNIDDLRTLRDGISNRYDSYHKLDKERFPVIEYNTNRANYEPLRRSFEEEFYVVRGIDRFNNNLYIPSTHTLSLIFSNDDYLPGKNILNTCRSYADGKSLKTPGETTNTELPTGPAHRPSARRLLWLTGLSILACLAMYAATSYLSTPSPPANLTISTPVYGQTVPRRLTIEGTVSNADTVWVVVHPVCRGENYGFAPPINDYYVQPPILVDTDGTWKGGIFIGSPGKDNVGMPFQIRAFVNPNKAYRVLDDLERYIFHAWPKAELSTKAIEVMRGPNETNR